MRSPTRQEIERLRASGQFDAEWYARTYPDVAALGMDPAVHYLTYGHRLRRESAPGIMATVATPAPRAARAPTPLDLSNPKRVLAKANEVARAGDHARAIALAEAHLPPELSYTANILRANAAIERQDESAWQHHLNSYLEKFDVAPIRLEGEGSLFERLACAPLPAVTGGPLVSVIMPAWNAEKTVRKAAQSILNQTWRNLELLIVDDASEDGTWAVLQAIAASDARVKILRNKVNVGPYVSKNFALIQASGEWITGHDADDWAHPERLGRHIAFAHPAGSAASVAHMIRTTPEGRVEHFTPIGEFSFDGVARVASISALFKAVWLREKLGFWDSVRIGADSEIISRAKVLLGRKFTEIKVPGMVCLDLPGSLTNNVTTGIRTPSGLSPVRMEYKRAWTEWHRLCKDKERICVDFPSSKRTFPAPREIRVSLDDVTGANVLCN